MAGYRERRKRAAARKGRTRTNSQTGSAKQRHSPVVHIIDAAGRLSNGMQNGCRLAQALQPRLSLNSWRMVTCARRMVSYEEVSRSKAESTTFAVPSVMKASSS